MRLKKLTTFGLFFLLCSLFLSLPVIAQDRREYVRLNSRYSFLAQWRPDDGVLAVGSSIGLWLLDQDHKIISELDFPHESQVVNLRWSPDGQYLAVVYERLVIPRKAIWEVWRITHDGLRVESMMSFSFSRFNYLDAHLNWHPNSKHLSTNRGIVNIFTQEISYLYRIPVIDGWTGDIVSTTDGTRVWWNPDGSQFVGISSVSSRSEIPFAIFDAAGGKMLVELSGEWLRDSSFTWSPDSSKVTNNHRVWDTRSGEVLAQVGDELINMLESHQSVWSEDSSTLFTLTVYRSPIDAMSTVYTTDIITGDLVSTQVFWPMLHSLQWRNGNLIAYAKDNPVTLNRNLRK